MRGGRAAGRDCDGHGPPGAAERARQPGGQDVPRAVQGVRGSHNRGPDPGQWRCEVPPRPDRRLREPVGQAPAGRVGGQPLPPRGRRPGGCGHGKSADGQHPGRRQLRPLPGHATADPRRRRLRGPGRGGRDVQPEPHQGIPGGRNDPPGDQQPARIHHDAGLGPLHPVLHRRGQDGRRADLPRERGRPRGLRARRPSGLRLPPEVQQGRRDRHDLLPAPRAQRGRRPQLHAAGDVPPHQCQAHGAHPVHRRAGKARRPQRRRRGTHPWPSTASSSRLLWTRPATRHPDTTSGPGDRRSRWA